jgi:hypothetical protein
MTVRNEATAATDDAIAARIMAAMARTLGLKAPKGS